jgi:hypothetical protein
MCKHIRRKHIRIGRTNDIALVNNYNYEKHLFCNH